MFNISLSFDIKSKASISENNFEFHTQLVLALISGVSGLMLPYSVNASCDK